jgi:hypothetical protein
MAAELEVAPPAAPREAVPEIGEAIDEALDIPALICSYDWPCAEALAVAWCESRWQPDAVSNDGQNFGLFQINAVHQARVDGDLDRLLDAATNVSVAFSIWRANGGWGPWSCKP